MSALAFLLSPVGRWLMGAGAVLGAVLALWLYVGAINHDRAVARALAASEAVEIAGLKANAAHLAQTAKISDAAEAKQIVVQHDIQVQTRTIVKEVPTYVTAQTDAECWVPVGLVRVFNAAATGADPATVTDPAGRPDAAASGINCSEVAAAVAESFGAARSNAAELTGLQAWNIEQATLH